LNDNMPDDVRQRLLPYVPRLIGTSTEEHEPARDEHFAWAAVRIFAPAALRAAGRRRMASRLQAAPSLPDAKEVASGILERLGPMSGRPTFLPGWEATHRAFRAAGAADYHARRGERPALNDGYTAGYCAASAAFHAQEAGVPGIWELGFEVLEGVLAIGAPQPEPQRLPTAEPEPALLGA
jgi:hypothetical protein